MCCSGGRPQAHFPQVTLFSFLVDGTSAHRKGANRRPTSRASNSHSHEVFVQGSGLRQPPLFKAKAQSLPDCPDWGTLGLVDLDVALYKLTLLDPLSLAFLCLALFGSIVGPFASAGRMAIELVRSSTWWTGRIAASTAGSSLLDFCARGNVGMNRVLLRSDRESGNERVLRNPE